MVIAVVRWVRLPVTTIAPKILSQTCFQALTIQRGLADG